jgi:hypothetical protein
MKLRHFFLFVAMVASSWFAQGQFREGFVITNHHDTIYGEVFHRMHASRYNVCRFRLDTEVKDYTPSELLGFGFTGDAYYSTLFVEGKFVEVLVHGKISLVLLNNVLYIHKEGYDIIAVKEGELITFGNRQYKLNPQWKGKLIYLMSDCNSTLFDPKRSAISTKEFIRIIKSYNNCINEPFVEYKTQKPWTRLETGLYAGMGVANVGILSSPTRVDFMKDNNYTTSSAVGLQLTVSSPRITERVALELYSGLNASKIHSLVVTQDELTTYYHESFFNINTFTLATNVRYTVFDRLPACYIHAGMQYYHNFYDLVVNTEELRWNTVHSTARGPGNNISKAGIGLNAGLSVMYKLPHFRLGAGLFYSASLIANDLMIAPIDNYTVRIIISR